MAGQLATTPIGKQQVLDLKAGTILRENSRKDNLMYGCPIGIVLFLIVFVKCGLITVWMIREYGAFDFRCASWNAESSLFRVKRWTLFSNSGNSDPRSFSKDGVNDDDKRMMNEVIVVNETKHRRPLYGASRRSTNFSISEPPKIDPSLDFGPLPPTFRRQQQHQQTHHDPETNEIPEVDDPDDLPLSTMVTLTNTQVIPLQGDGQESHGTVKMKTIRNRVEKVGSGEEQFIEIDIANAPRIYVSKIKSRQGGDEEEAPDFDLLKDLVGVTEDPSKKNMKKKKGKGKGLKKARKQQQAALNNTNNSTTPTNDPPNEESDKKPEKHHRKKDKNKKDKKKKQKTHENEIPEIGSEITKSPRHLFSGAASTGSHGMTTPRPHKSSWINGVIDPEDPKFSNQGEIRGYPMKKATKKPDAETTTPSTPSTSDSDGIKHQTSSEEDHIKISDSTRIMWDMDELKYTTFMAPKTTETTKLIEDDVQEEKSNVVGSSSEETHSIPNKTPSFSSSSSSSSINQVLPVAPKSDRYAATTGNGAEAVYHVFSSPSTTGSPLVLTAVASIDVTTPFDEQQYGGAASESPYYVEVNDADTETVYIKDVTSIYRNILLDNPETTTKPYDPMHFEMELAKLKDSTTCLARMAFDIWCIFVLFSSIPFFMGICVPRWSLFVLHIVFDFLFLVVGCVSSLTIAIMSGIMYFLIDEMSSDSLFEFLLVAFVIDIILILYSIIVVITYRCCRRLVDNFVKDSNANYNYNYSPVSGEQV